MPLYKLLYLPTKDQIFTDGCTVIDLNGEVSEWKEHHDTQDYIRVAEPFLVRFEYNQMIIVGRPSVKSLRFLNVGQDIKSVDTNMLLVPEKDGYYRIQIRCPVCSVWH
jgi:hypothetical protein